jgi:hypothetical protein
VRAAVACLIASMGAAPGLAQEASPETPRQPQVLRVGGTPVVSVDLARGDVEVRGGASGIVRLWSRPFPGSGGSSADTAAGTPFVLREENGTISVRARSPDSGRGILLVIEVPTTTELGVRLGRGDVTVSGVAGAISISTTRGDVRLEQIRGGAVVDTRNGSIRGSFQSLDARLPSAFSTLNGDVTLSLPTGAAVDLDLRCRGCTLEHVRVAGEFRRTRILAPPDGDPVLALQGRTAAGGPTLRVFTWNGEIQVNARAP